MDDNDLEVLECSESPEPSEQMSNTAMNLVAFIHNKCNFCNTMRFCFFFFRV